MSKPQPKASDTPRVERKGPITVAGIARTYPCDGPNDIPAQWQALGPRMAALADAECTGYGVCTAVSGNAESYQYLAGVRVTGTKWLPEGFTSQIIPARSYAVFTHRGNATRIPAAVQAIFHDDLPRMGLKPDGEPGLIEVYDERFDPSTGSGEIEFWIPIRERA
jgi:AraC family transcriptional regulator